MTGDAAQPEHDRERRAPTASVIRSPLMAEHA
jgi:hypothetical protein